MPTFKSYTCLAVIAGVAVTAANAQISSINSAVITPRVFNDYPGATGNYVNAYPGSITLGETGEVAPTGFANRDVWYFAHNGTAYSMLAGDYFTASMTLNVTGSTTVDNEAGFYVPNTPSGLPGGDLQFIADPNSGFLGMFGGSGFWNSGLTYTAGETVTLGMKYFYDSANSVNAFQFSVTAGTTTVSSPVQDLPSGDSLVGGTVGGYFQLQGMTNSPGSFGQAVFGNITISAVPEPTVFVLAGLGVGALLTLRRRK